MSTTKKVNWKDEVAITQTVTESSSYNEVLKKLNLKAVSSNTRTLKKYIEKYEIDISHFDYQQEKDPAKYKVKEGEEPWVDIKGMVHDPVQGIRVDLDWNSAFVDYLKQSGYTGTTDEQIIGKWLVSLYKDVGERMRMA